MDLFPAIEPYNSGQLPVSDANSLYWETVGTPTGLPIIYLHGGPGSGCTLGMRRFFDPSVFRAVLFDQRGCGRSTPRADDPATDLSANTTDQLIADIESLRERLGIQRWVVAGVSWGVSLGLAYAQAHPDRVIGMALGAITSGRRMEVEWITRDMRRIFPREWERFVEPVPEAERDGNLAAAYARLLVHPDVDVRENAALRWCEWEDTHVSLVPGWKPSPRYQDPAFRMMFTRLVTHYWGHDCFLAENQLLDGMNRLAGIPAILVHGRYDVSGPLDTAWELSHRWENSRLVVIDDAGHGDGSFTNHLVAAINTFTETPPPHTKPRAIERKICSQTPGAEHPQQSSTN
ncbi:prolyl aminopeptidase [Rhodococcus sp. ACT016]|uniref:prolyl aminopeptidase n=1 Tax=Rhodococcus sp. ACT016 TaxID=3134808 RepID=UPI003D2A3D3A